VDDWFYYVLMVFGVITAVCLVVMVIDWLWPETEDPF
jgi:preprotein translocase subunit SecE